MFDILIVEDNTEKLKNILKVLKLIEGLNIETIDHELDSFSAKKRIKEKSYDLMILDIAIPHRKCDDADLEGGVKLLSEILERGHYRVPIHIIGLTAHDEVFEKATEEFKSNLLSVVRYSETDIQWQEVLKKGVEQRIESKLASGNGTVEYDYDIAIITAIEKEFEAVKSLSSKWERVRLPNDNTPYYKSTFKREAKEFSVIAACAPQMGMNASSVLSMKLIHNFRPRYMFMTGIAASIKDSHTHGFGDVIVVDESWDGGAGKITQNENGERIFLHAASHLRLNSDISEMMRSFRNDSSMLRRIKDSWSPNDTPNTELSIHIGAMVSVAGVIENSAVVKELKIENRKLLGLEMEVHGMYYSANNCSNPKPIAIALKSVSDFASIDKGDSYQAYAAYTSANVMFEFILNELPI